MPPLGCRLLPLLAAALLASALRASDAIPNEPITGRSATVTQPHVTAELIPEITSYYDPNSFLIALHLHMDPAWHTYWTNPGDAGLATAVKWTLSDGRFAAGPIQWPTPEIHPMGPLTTYGYGGDVYLLTEIGPQGGVWEGPLPKKLEIKAHATWLVCQEECIPGQADLAITLNYTPHAPAPDEAREAFFRSARLRVPIVDRTWAYWDVAGAYRGGQLALSFTARPGTPHIPGKLSFFAEQPNVIDTKSVELQPDGTAAPDERKGRLPLIQNGEKPDHLSGVLVSDQPIVGTVPKYFPGDAKAIYFPSFPVAGAPATTTTAPAGTPAVPNQSATAAGPAPNSQVSFPGPSPATSASAPFLPAILAAAFLGGLILNLMPCVLPVLSLKVFSLIRHAGENAGGAWKQGLAFAAGVLVSFWILAGLLIALESAGQHLGWGFQMQSPGFVLALVFLFFLLGLNLFGVFELGTSLVGLDAKVTTGLGGLASSFANGALATLAATPCTAPFMGSAVGFAAQQPAAISLFVFTALALGMAAPYLALTTFPGAMRLVPKPGAWMETLKQFMGFLLMGTVIFLVYVFGALTGEDSVPPLLGALLVAAVAAWIFGRGTGPTRSGGARVAASLAALLLLALALGEGVRLARETPPTAGAVAQDGWRPWSPAAVRQELAQGRPVFVDFTAAWCLSCKVNERVALDLDSTKKLFAAKRVALFRGDWTHSDPQISDTLRQFNRSGVPLYLVYSPQAPDAPQVLPEVLTPGLVQDALQKLP